MEFWGIFIFWLIGMLALGSFVGMLTASAVEGTADARWLAKQSVAKDKANDRD